VGGGVLVVLEWDVGGGAGGGGGGGGERKGLIGFARNVFFIAERV